MAKTLRQRVETLERELIALAEIVERLHGRVRAHNLALALVADIACGASPPSLVELIGNLRKAEAAARQQNEGEGVMMELRSLAELLAPLDERDR